MRMIIGLIFVVAGLQTFMFRDMPTIASPQTWTSPHLIDCLQISADPEKEREQEFFKEIRLTNPYFLMNIHDPSKDSVSKEIYDKGCWECSHIKSMLKALSTYHNSYFLDIGGNIGMWSLAAAAANHQTFTIEALWGNIERICKSINRNSLHNRIHLMHIAATSEPQTFRLDIQEGNIGGTRVFPIMNETSKKDVDSNEVQGVTINSLNLPLDRPLVMKIDVEGHELQALLGATSFLRSANIVYAMMELRSNLHMDERWREIFGIFMSKGLRPFRMDYEDETALDVDDLRQWKHFKHPHVLYFDVVWKFENFLGTSEMTEAI